MGLRSLSRDTERAGTLGGRDDERRIDLGYNGDGLEPTAREACSWSFDVASTARLGAHLTPTGGDSARTLAEGLGEVSTLLSVESLEWRLRPSRTRGGPPFQTSRMAVATDPAKVSRVPASPLKTSGELGSDGQRGGGGGGCTPTVADADGHRN